MQTAPHVAAAADREGHLTGGLDRTEGSFVSQPLVLNRIMWHDDLLSVITVKSVNGISATEQEHDYASL